VIPSLESRLKSEARSLGFELAGIAPASDADGFDRLTEWLARGYAGEMAYLHQHEQARRHPSSVLPEVRSVLMLGMNYGGQSSTEPGRIARYAQGPDYHDLIRERLNQLLVWLQNEVPECIGRGVVDTAPLLERDFARRAGLGWIGKNTLLINRKQGSFLFLAALLTNLDLKPDAPFAANHCGSCTRCLDACPTDAFN